MRKYIVTSFVLIFILFGIGSGMTIFYLLKTTSNLSYLISLHEIEDIRQELSFNLLKTQNYTFSSPSFFANNLDDIIDTASVLTTTVMRCHECHHTQEIETELDGVEVMIEEYEEQLSYLVTTVTEGELRRNLQIKVLDHSNVIINTVQGMVNRAANTLNRKTSYAMHKINRSYIILGVTLLLTFFAALLVAQYLTSRITKPIDELHTAANKIAEGEVGYQEYKGREEFEALISTFNTMSASLAQHQETIQTTMQKLNHLNSMSVPLHSAHDISIILNYLRSSINALINVEHIGILLSEEQNDHFVLYMFDTGAAKTARIPITVKRAEILQLFRETNRKRLLQNNLQGGGWPFTEKPQGINPDNLLVVWMLIENNVNGALIAVNKKDDDFNREDSRVLGILANNMSVALENILLLKEAQQHMLELKKMQRQLIEAEKLTALGTLAGGVAHDFNNILCGMIGYVALLKRNHAPDDKDFKMLDTIEKAGFRAANLTKQLLTFSRQEAMDHRPIEVNEHIDNVAKLLENTISKLITIKLELGDPLPPVLSDPAQLEQIIMNLSVNARDAMPNGGQILIKSEQVIVDDNFCEMHPEAKPGNFIKITVSDEGEGIDQEILPRIFEPFFTTKEFGKGSGLGLAMVYGIVKSHKGFIMVASSAGKGTIFTVYLPVISVIPEQEIKPAVNAAQALHASILIIDDEELVASMLAEHLQSLGCHTFLASNGEEALDILYKYSDIIDAAILDINMPVMDGTSAFEKMIEMKPDLKVLVASAYTLKGSAEEILAKGAHGFIQKPYSLENIAQKIAQALGR
jgi:signal transduction histidine kinase/HAMP domain-containing protein